MTKLKDIGCSLVLAGGFVTALAVPAQANAAFAATITALAKTTQQIDNATRNRIRVKFINAEKAFDAGNYKDALAKLQEIDALTGGRKIPTAHALLIKTLFQLEDYDAAARELDALYSGTPSDQVLADIADYAGRIEGMRAELNAKREQEARRRDDAAWATAMAGGTEASFEAYRREFPAGRNIANLDRELSRVDNAAWTAAVNAGKPAGFAAYRNAFPTGIHIGEVREALRRADDAAAQKATRDGSMSALSQYLSDFPNGAHAATIRQQQSNKRGQLQDDNAWAAAVSGGTQAAFEQYRSAFPAGVHMGEYEQTLATADDKAHANAARAGTATAALSYLEAFPDGRHKAAMVELTKSAKGPEYFFLDPQFEKLEKTVWRGSTRGAQLGDGTFVSCAYVTDRVICNQTAEDRGVINSFTPPSQLERVVTLSLPDGGFAVIGSDRSRRTIRKKCQKKRDLKRNGCDLIFNPLSIFEYDSSLTLTKSIRTDINFTSSVAKPYENRYHIIGTVGPVTFFGSDRDKLHSVIISRTGKVLKNKKAKTSNDPDLGFTYFLKDSDSVITFVQEGETNMDGGRDFTNFKVFQVKPEGSFGRSKKLAGANYKNARSSYSSGVLPAGFISKSSMLSDGTIVVGWGRSDKVCELYTMDFDLKFSKFGELPTRHACPTLHQLGNGKLLASANINRSQDRKNNRYAFYLIDPNSKSISPLSGLTDSSQLARGEQALSSKFFVMDPDTAILLNVFQSRTSEEKRVTLSYVMLDGRVIEGLEFRPEKMMNSYGVKLMNGNMYISGSSQWGKGDMDVIRLKRQSRTEFLEALQSR